MKNILIIDDDIHIGNVLEETLAKEDIALFVRIQGQKRCWCYQPHILILFCWI